MPSSNSIIWNEKQPMPRPHAGGAAGFIGGELIVAGGTAWDGETKLWLSPRDTGPGMPRAMPADSIKARVPQVISNSSA